MSGIGKKNSIENADGDTGKKIIVLHETSSDGLSPDGAQAECRAREADMARWNNVRVRLKTALGENIWRCWLRHLHFVEKTGSTIVLGAASRLMVNNISSRYADRLRANCRLEWPDIDRVEIIKSAPAPAMEPRGDTGGVNEGVAGDVAAIADTGGMDDDFTDFGSRIDARMTFQSFITDTSNEIAHRVALEAAAHAGNPKFNPLYLHGGVGLGKTHLMHAIATSIRTAHPRVVYMTAETFMHLFIKALRHQDMDRFKERFRSVDVLMLDDIQFIDAGEKLKTQEELLYTLNALMNDNKQVIIAADRPATEFARVDERLRSRLNWGMVAGIAPATGALRLGMIEARNRDDAIGLDRPVMEFLAEKITSNLRELEGALNRLAAHARISGRIMDIDAVRAILADVLRLTAARISVAGIKREVARHYGISIQDMDSRRRSQTIVLPRHVAMYLAKVLTTGSYPEIGRHFGGRDHTTVMHAVTKITGRINPDDAARTDRDLADAVAMLRARLSTGSAGSPARGTP